MDDNLKLKIDPPDFSEMGELHERTIREILDVVKNTINDERVVNEVIQSMEDDMENLFKQIGVSKK